MKNSGGVYVRLNGNQSVQKVAGSKGVMSGLNKSATVTKKAGGRVGGGNKAATVSPTKLRGATKKGK
jgi:hypothetical protein